MLISTVSGSGPAVVLVHGSGQQDRDSTSGPNKPFRDLAHGLASRGILVLRYDKRTRVHAQKTVALTGGSLEDVAHEYFKSSEQIPTRVRLAVAEEFSAGKGLKDAVN